MTPHPTTPDDARSTVAPTPTSTLPSARPTRRAALKARVGAWVARHLVATDPHDEPSRLDRWDGAATKSGNRRPRAAARHDVAS